MERNEKVKYYGSILPPTEDRVEEYLKELRKYPQKMGTLFVLLCGGYINHPKNTVDLDFVLYDTTRDEKNYADIATFMNWCMILGNKYNLWVDIVLHVDKCWNFDANPQKFIKMSSFNYIIENGIKTWERKNIIKKMPFGSLCEDKLPKEKQLNDKEYPRLVAII